MRPSDLSHSRSKMSPHAATRAVSEFKQTISSYIRRYDSLTSEAQSFTQTRSEARRRSERDMSDLGS